MRVGHLNTHKQQLSEAIHDLNGTHPGMGVSKNVVVDGTRYLYIADPPRYTLLTFAPGGNIKESKTARSARSLIRKIKS